MKNKKCIIIDFDSMNNSLSTLLGIKKYKEKITKGIILYAFWEPLEIGRAHV